MNPDLVALAARVGAHLQNAGWMLATAESCTGGLVAAAVTDTAGSSVWFERGFVTYSNAAKTELLGVPMATLEAHGAVSEPTALAMAQGALRHSHAQVAPSITGIAGPGGAVPGKPVGTVCFGWAMGRQTYTQTRHFPGDRGAVRQAAALFALEELDRLLKTGAKA
jgi:nicotinamide-nucleotide amidase